MKEIALNTPEKTGRGQSQTMPASSEKRSKEPLKTFSEPASQTDVSSCGTTLKIVQTPRISYNNHDVQGISTNKRGRSKSGELFLDGTGLKPNFKRASDRNRAAVRSLGK
ncbi:unnamed protein product [Ilex paraguariensis]|uniref:Uncharacterized protein n=1 Tax=Ilex paraguariensis TaxID=185542 RepID=A0ABC8R156_9AQUA